MIGRTSTHRAILPADSPSQQLQKHRAASDPGNSRRRGPGFASRRNFRQNCRERPYGQTTSHCTDRALSGDAPMRSKIQPLVFLGLIACSTIAAAADEPDVKVLIANLKSSKAAVRRSAAKGLAEAGKKAADAVKELAVALGDDDAEVRYFAVAALGEIG